MKYRFLTPLIIILILAGCQGSKQTSGSSVQVFTFDKKGNIVKSEEFKYIDGKVLSISPDKIIIADFYKNRKSIFTIGDKTEFIEWRKKNREKVTVKDIKESDLVRITYPLDGQLNALVIQKNFYDTKWHWENRYMR